MSSARQVSCRGAQTQNFQRTLAGRQSHESRPASLLFHAQFPDGLFLRHTRRWQGDSKDLSQGAFLLTSYVPPAEESALAKLLQEISGNVTSGRIHAT